jgi:hypothetical protein
MDEDTLHKLYAIEKYIDDSIRIEVVNNKFNNLLTKVKILEYDMKRLNKEIQTTNRELIGLKRATMYRTKRGKNNEIYNTNRRKPRNKKIHDKR